MLCYVLALMGSGGKRPAGPGFARETSTLAPSPSPSDKLEQLRQYLSVDLRDRVLGTTPDCRGVRENQILELVERYDFELWDAVDDREDGFPTTAAMHLAKTEYFDGLVPATFTRLAWILQL